MNRRNFLIASVAALSATGVTPTWASTRQMTVYKDPNCGCCKAWAEAMAGANFDVRVEPVDDISAVKRRYEVPAEVEGCHTAIVEGYFLEGHVPLEAVERMMKEQPDIRGLAVSGMPQGSLGMGNDPTVASYDVMAVSRDSNAYVYLSVRPLKA